MREKRGRLSSSQETLARHIAQDLAQCVTSVQGATGDAIQVLLREKRHDEASQQQVSEARTVWRMFLSSCDAFHFVFLVPVRGVGLAGLQLAACFDARWLSRTCQVHATDG